MTQAALASPAFGEADLSNCEREQIHLAGSIQPHGVLLVVGEPELVVVQASANAASFLGLAGAPHGRALVELSPDLGAHIAPLLSESIESVSVPIRCHVGSAGTVFDALVHRLPAGGLVIELERPGPAVDLTASLEGALSAVVGASSVRAVCDETARVFRALTGYDRVMVYRFDADGHGEVLSEERRATLEALLGNRYPASDIPQMARRLYERNRVRVLVDVDYEPVPVLPRLSPLTRQELDMSMCFLRSMSPIHIQYLKNMGVSATLVVSLMVGGRLWGLVSCHHYAPRVLQREARALCELLAEVVGTRIAALESFAQSQALIAVRRLEQRMIEAISRDGDWRSALFTPADALLKPIGATGAALLLDGQVLTAGEVPGTQQLRELSAWLDAKGLQGAGPPALFHTCSLGLDEPAFASMIGAASGVLAAPLSRSAGEYLIWFRPEQVRTVTWGGNPFKPMNVGNSPSDLSPRRSFAQWHQVVEGTSEPWTAPTLTTAQLFGASVSDVIVQFRAVTMLIAQNQLDMVRRQVERSDQAVIVAAADGRIVLANKMFEALLPASHAELTVLEDLSQVFVASLKVRRRLRELVSRRQTWRGEAEIVAGEGAARPVLVRADTVFSAPDKVLGFVVVVTDLAEQKAADAGRLRFQEKVVARSRARLESEADLVYENLLSSIMENAQLAAMEITEGVEVSAMPRLLESVHGSVDRSAELLRHLVRLSVSAADGQ